MEPVFKRSDAITIHTVRQTCVVAGYAKREDLAQPLAETVDGHFRSGSCMVAPRATRQSMLELSGVLAQIVKPP